MLKHIATHQMNEGVMTTALYHLGSRAKALFGFGRQRTRTVPRLDHRLLSNRDLADLNLPHELRSRIELQRAAARHFIL